MSELVTNKITPSTGSSDTVTMGDASDTFEVPSGVTLNVASGATISNSGTATGFGAVGITLGTEQATTSASDFTFTGIPAGTKRVYFLFEEVASSGGSDDWILQLGDSGGIETSGYITTGVAGTSANNISTANSTASFIMKNNGSLTVTGVYCFELTDSTNNTWIGHSVIKSHTNQGVFSAGSKSLSGALTQIKLDTSGSDTFNGGSANITYE